MEDQAGKNSHNVPNLLLNEPDSSIVPHALLFIVQILALILPPFRGRRSTFSVLIVALAIRAHLGPHFTNNVGLAQPFTISWSYYMATLAKLAFSGNQGPEARFWRIDRPQKEAMSFAAFGWAKLKWAFTLVANQRGIRWNHEVKNVPPVRTRRKSMFLAEQAYRFIQCMLIADLLGQLSIRLFYTSPDGRVGHRNSKYLTLQHPDPRWSFAKCLVFASTPYFMLSMQYAQFAFLAVLLGLGRPEDWPSPFGRLRDTTTVRDFWGRYWHQQLRHMLTSYTDAFINALGIPRRTNWSSYTTLYLAFLISGTFHALSQMTMPCPSNITFAERTHGFFLFFIWQMAAITIEDIAQWCFRQAVGASASGGPRVWKRWVGYIWIMVSMWASIPLVGDTFLRMRMGEQALLPFTVTGPLVERYIPIPP